MKIAAIPTITPTPTNTPVFGGASYLYDGDGNMVRGTINHVTTYYISRAYQITNGVVTKYYGSYAMRVNGTVYYLLSDHLGSTSITLNATGQFVAELRYKAFGETRYTKNNTPTDYRYTGQLQQAEIGLYYYGVRWYDPMLGRFTQADSIIPNAGSTKAFDRYAYVNNNPMNFTDPSGHDAYSTCGGNQACMSYVQANPIYLDHSLGINFRGDWTQANKIEALKGPWLTAKESRQNKLINFWSSGLNGI